MSFGVDSSETSAKVAIDVCFRVARVLSNPLPDIRRCHRTEDDD